MVYRRPNIASGVNVARGGLVAGADSHSRRMPAMPRFCGSARGYRYSEDLEALCAGEVLAQLRRSRLEPIGYSDLAE